MRRISPTDPSTCPVILDAQSALDHAHNFNAAIRKLTRSIKLCFSCDLADGCLNIREISRQIDLAILEVNQEWKL